MLVLFIRQHQKQGAAALDLGPGALTSNIGVVMQGCVFTLKT